VCVVLHIVCVNFVNIRQVLGYCVKCRGISPISVSYILQGSTTTHLRCDGKYGIGFVANFLENTTVIEFWKSANICQSYERMYGGTGFFWLTVYVNNTSQMFAWSCVMYVYRVTHGSMVLLVTGSRDPLCARLYKRVKEHFWRQWTIIIIIIIISTRCSPISRLTITF